MVFPLGPYFLRLRSRRLPPANQFPGRSATPTSELMTAMRGTLTLFPDSLVGPSVSVVSTSTLMLHHGAQVTAAPSLAWWQTMGKETMEKKLIEAMK